MIRKPSEMLTEYEKSYFFRAIVQAVPYGGSIDTLLAGRASEINKRRLDELLSNLSQRLDVMDQSMIRHEYLGSEEFFDLLRSAVEVVIKCSDDGKRKLVADFLVGDAINPEPNDLSFQVVEDLRVLQAFHLQVLKEMLDGVGMEVNRLARRNRYTGWIPLFMKKRFQIWKDWVLYVTTKLELVHGVAGAANG